MVRGNNSLPLSDAGVFDLIVGYITGSEASSVELKRDWQVASMHFTMLESKFIILSPVKYLSTGAAPSLG